MTRAIAVLGEPRGVESERVAPQVGIAVRDPDGKPVRMAGSIQDIDEQKRAQNGRHDGERHGLSASGVGGTPDLDQPVGQGERGLHCDPRR